MGQGYIRYSFWNNNFFPPSRRTTQITFKDKTPIVVHCKYFGPIFLSAYCWLPSAKIHSTLLLARHLLAHLGTLSMHHTTWPTIADAGHIGTLFRAKYWPLLYAEPLYARIWHHVVLWSDAISAHYLLEPPPNPLNPIIAAMAASSSGISATKSSCVAVFVLAVRASPSYSNWETTVCCVVGSLSAMGRHYSTPFCLP